MQSPEILKSSTKMPGTHNRERIFSSINDTWKTIYTYAKKEKKEIGLLPFAIHKNQLFLQVSSNII